MIKYRANGQPYDSTGHGEHDELLAALSGPISFWTAQPFWATWIKFTQTAFDEPRKGKK